MELRLITTATSGIMANEVLHILLDLYIPYDSNIFGPLLLDIVKIACHVLVTLVTVRQLAKPEARDRKK